MQSIASFSKNSKEILEELSLVVKIYKNLLSQDSIGTNIGGLFEARDMPEERLGKGQGIHCPQLGCAFGHFEGVSANQAKEEVVLKGTCLEGLPYTPVGISRQILYRSYPLLGSSMWETHNKGELC